MCNSNSLQDYSQNKIERTQDTNAQAEFILKGCASVLSTHSSKESNSSSPNRSHKYFRVSAVQKLSIVSILCMGSLLTSCTEYENSPKIRVCTCRHHLGCTTTDIAIDRWLGKKWCGSSYLNLLLSEFKITGLPRERLVLLS